MSRGGWLRRTVALLAVAATAACTPLPQAPPAPAVATAAPERTAPEDAPAAATDVAPRGDVTVAYPDPVGTWWGADGDDLAAIDLASLWALPLYRWDPLGRARPALATDVRVVESPAGWSVEVDLAAGEWSDGESVGADDVVATTTALQDVRPAAWSAFVGAVVVDESTVRLDFDRPYAAWPTLLSGVPGVLPAHVLEEQGIAAYADGLPVTGGWFRSEEWEPGLRSSFAAHGEGPLGPPAVASVEVVVVPGHDVALGLLDDGRADALVGHVALDPSRRRAAVEGVEGAVAFGGTRFELAWGPEGAGAAARRAAANGLDPAPFVEGLLRDVGRSAGGVAPGTTGVAPAAGDEADGRVAIQVTRTVEGLGLLARRLQADLDDAGVAASLVRVDPPAHLREPLPVDARLRVVRLPPSGSLAGRLAAVGLDAEAGVAADATAPATLDPLDDAEVPTGPHAEVAALLADDPRLLPVADVAVTHAWVPDRVRGIEPSGWPGVGLWNVGRWEVPG